jgi:hypothetical protein
MSILPLACESASFYAEADDHFPREIFFFGFGLPEVAGFSVPAFLPFAIVFPFHGWAFRGQV